MSYRMHFATEAIKNIDVVISRRTYIWKWIFLNTNVFIIDHRLDIVINTYMIIFCSTYLSIQMFISIIFEKYVVMGCGSKILICTVHTRQKVCNCQIILYLCNRETNNSMENWSNQKPFSYYIRTGYAYRSPQWLLSVIAVICSLFSQMPWCWLWPLFTMTCANLMWRKDKKPLLKKIYIFIFWKHYIRREPVSKILLYLFTFSC